jgi:hypothetical protein
MSLWGTRDRYLEGAIANAALAAAIYPGWTLRIYCSPDVSVIDRLRALGADVQVVAGPLGAALLFRRFLPAADPSIDHLIVRDADSRLNVREKAAVDAWMASRLPFHVMRDHFAHRLTPMLGGMWGCRGGSIPDIGDRIARRLPGGVKYGDDQIFLRDEIWPLVAGRCLVHTSVPHPLGGDPFPAHPPYAGFVGAIVDPRTEAARRIAILLPSRGRPAAALAAARSALATAAEPEALRVLIGVEPAEAAEYRDRAGPDASWIHALQSGGSYVRAIRELHQSVRAGIYGLSADDFVFETPGWDDRIRKTAADLPHQLGVMFGDDGIQGGRLATAPFMTAEWIACVGDVLPGDYAHMFCDTEVTDIARKAGLLRFLPDVKIAHRHHLAGQAVFDATYERGLATTDAGRAEFIRRAPQRQHLADRLTRAIGAPGLSLLVTGRADRAERIDGLVAALVRQIETLADPSSVEVLADVDGGERTTAAKRLHLIGKARGAWVAWIDDEPRLAGTDDVALLLAAIDRADAPAPEEVPVGSAVPGTAWIGPVRRAAAAAAVPRDAGSASTGRSHVVDAPLDRSLPLPSADEQRLLAAALREGPAALRAWRMWTGDVGLERVDAASAAILPLAWWNLDRLGARGVDVNALKPYYWANWAASQTCVHFTAAILALFRHAGLPVLIVGAGALAVRHYQKPHLRTVRSIELLVPEGGAADARRLLPSIGWRPLGLNRFAHWPRVLLELRVDGGGEAALRPGVWDRADVVPIEGVAARVPSAADHLLLICATDHPASERDGVQWVADVARVAGSGARLDPDVLADEALATGRVAPVRQAVEFVRRTFEVEALEPACERLGGLTPAVRSPA